MSIQLSFITDTLSPLLWIPLLYAETHFRFKYFFSRLSKAEPELIADCPSRIQKGEPIPALIIVKDADLYPVTLTGIEVYQDANRLLSFPMEQLIRNKYEEIIMVIPSINLAADICNLRIRIKYQMEKSTRECWNDNHWGTSHAPFPVYISADPLPRLDGCLYGEVHAHTIYTSDQVEFGASLAASARLAQAMGLDFYCATDHSYDMDDQPDNYLLNDPALQKWTRFWKEVDAYNKNNKFIIIPGEEVTVRNSRNKNVHCLVYNSHTFFPGSGDGAEKWFRTWSELSIPEVLNRLSGDSLAFAAHPAEKPPLLQRILLKRGDWRPADCENSCLHGLQFINNSGSYADNAGIKLWISLLLKGYRLTGLAGNDAHGNFARFRQIRIPALKMRENYLHLFGQWRTGVYTAEKNKTLKGILDSIRNGACFMTNGPALSLMALDEWEWHHTGDQVKNMTRIKIRTCSSPEFSALKSIKIFVGFTGSQQEEVLFQDELSVTVYDYVKEVEIKPNKMNGYYRAEIITKSGKMALSNPVWF